MIFLLKYLRLFRHASYLNHYLWVGGVLKSTFSRKPSVTPLKSFRFTLETRHKKQYCDISLNLAATSTQKLNIDPAIENYPSYNQNIIKYVIY